MSYPFADQGCWAILPDRLDGVTSLLAAPEAELRALATPARSAPPVAANGEVAVLHVVGPIIRYDGFLSDLLNWPTVASLARQLATANDDPATKRIVLEIDSPGGTAAGIGELAAMIRASKKPVTAVVDHLSASGAYWLASACAEVVISRSAMLGSIGVVASHRREKEPPIKVISSQSPLKQASPETDAGRAELQRVVDQLAAVFISDVATYRNVTSATVTSQFGRGGLLVGKEAIAAGMADRFGTLRQVLDGTLPPASLRPRQDPKRAACDPFGSPIKPKTRLPDGLAKALELHNASSRVQEAQPHG